MTSLPPGRQIAAMPDAIHLSCSWFTKSFSMTLLPPLVDRMPALPNSGHFVYSVFMKSITMASQPPPDRQNAGIAKRETSFLHARGLRNPSLWRHYFLLIDRMPALPNARHFSSSWLTKSIAMTSLPLPGRQNAGHARRDTSFLLVVYEIYRYDVTTSSWSTECRH